MARSLRVPGTVVRCRSCEDAVTVLVTIRGITCVDLRGLVRLEPAGSGASACRRDARS